MASLSEPSATATPVISCALCCEEVASSQICALSTCSHESCKTCLIKWIEKAEAAGHKDHAACPYCRVALTADETLNILGRPFEPRVATTPTTLSQEVQLELDDLTLQWLQEQTKPCPSCGAYIEKIQGGCDMMECLCGFRFCYGCGAQGAMCACTPSFHRFWDNVLNQQAALVAPPSARLDAETGCLNLKQHICQRKQEERTKRVRLERMERREQQAHERLEDANWSAPWLYCTRTKEASVRVLGQVLRGQSVRWVRGRKRLEEDREQLEMDVDVGKWLYSSKDGGFGVLKNMYSTKALKKRGRRAKVRANNGKPLSGVDAAFSSGKWLYYCKDRASTLRQVERFSESQQNETGVHFDRWFLRDDFWCGCGDLDCDDCLDAGKDAKDNAIRLRVFFLDEAAKALEMEEINKNGL